jgi:DNA-binding transcriptional LysR family regulator
VLALAEHRQFAAAAERLGMAQSQISNLVARMESRLGYLLFTRRPRVALTPAGEAIVASLRQSVAITSAAAERAKKLAEGQIGSVVIGLASSAAASPVPRAIHRFRAANPEVLLILKEAHSAEHSDALLAEIIDIAIGRELAQAHDLHSELLIEEPLVAALAADHPLSRLEVLPLTALAPEPFVLFPRVSAPQLHDAILGACVTSGFVPNVSQEAREWHTVLNFVAAGLGVALVPAGLTALTWPGLVYRPISECTTRVRTYLTWRRVEKSTAVRSVLECLRKANDGASRSDAAA